MSDTKMTSRIQEDLVTLYLRLNGFFVTNLIVHSPDHGRNRTQIDALALRLRWQAERERQIGGHEILDLSSTYDELLICEVKSKGQQLQFNSALRDRDSCISTVLQWSGLFEEHEVRSITPKVHKLINNNTIDASKPPTFIGPRNIRIRAILFSPNQKTKRNNQPYFINEGDIFTYIQRCLCPDVPRTTCATTYDLTSWGNLEPVVRFFKRKDGKLPKNYKSLENYLKQ